MIGTAGSNGTFETAGTVGTGLKITLNFWTFELWTAVRLGTLERLEPAVAWNALNRAKRWNVWNGWNCWNRPQDHLELLNLELW